jgi:prevent-host-death family protein
MSMQVNLKEARDRLSQLVQAVEDGEQVTICKNGKPVVDLVPVQEDKKANLEKLKGLITVVDPDGNRKPRTNEEVEAWLKGEFE